MRIFSMKPVILHIGCLLADKLEDKSSSGTTAISVNDFEWFQNCLPTELREKIEMQHAYAPGIPRYPDLGAVDGIIIGGSEHMLSRGDNDWTPALKEYVRQAADRGIPMLGVCYGHQLLAQVFGAKVVHRNPREFGRKTVRLTAAGKSDPLFRNLPELFPVLMAHSDAVVELPPPMQSLAANEFNDTQAMALKHQIRGVQFHPEFSREIMQALSRQEERALETEGLAPEAIRRELQDTPAARIVVENFVRYFVLA